MARSTMGARDAAEAAFRKATTKPVEAPAVEAPAVEAPAVEKRSASIPGVREPVTLRLDKDVLEHFQADGPGWQDRLNAALRKAAGLA